MRNAMRTNDIRGLRATVYGTCAAVVLLCLALVIWVLLHSAKPVVPQHDSYVPNHAVPQYYSPALPHCYTPCILRDESRWRTT